MAYQINLTNGTLFATIADGTINTSTNLTLVGKNYPGYGEFLDENFIHLLENAANNTAPSAPLTGQLWFNTTTKVLQVWQGVAWKSLGGATASAAAPSNSQTGDLWFDTVNQQLKVYDATVTPNPWILVGPQFSGASGVTGAIPAVITDTDGNPHTIIQMTVANAIVATVSKDATFTPTGAGITGFANIRPGIHLASSVSGVIPQFFGTANNSSTLNGVPATGFVQSLANAGAQTMQNSLSVNNDVGLRVGVDNDLAVSISGTTVTVQNQNIDGNVVFRVNDGGIQTTVMTLDGANGVVDFGATNPVFSTISAASITKTGTSGVGNIGQITNLYNNIFASGLIGNTVSVTGNVTGGNLLTSGTFSAASLTSTGALTVNSTGSATAIINAAGNAVGNIGSASGYFNRVFATSTSALYADVAERFASDMVLEPGTVVKLGGAKEITLVAEELSEDVLGVISSHAAFLMNGGAGEDDTHPPVAVTGRVPVKTKGPVRKGDRLVSAGDGAARAARPGEDNWRNVIGRALTNKDDDDIGCVEAIVTIH